MGLRHTPTPQLENRLEGNQQDFPICSLFLAVVVKGVLVRERLRNTITRCKNLVGGHQTLSHLVSVISEGAPAVHPEPLSNALFVNTILKKHFKKGFLR